MSWNKTQHDLLEAAQSDMCLEYSKWISYQDLDELNLGSADEHVNDPRLKLWQRRWLRNYCARWEALDNALTAVGTRVGDSVRFMIDFDAQDADNQEEAPWRLEDLLGAQESYTALCAWARSANVGDSFHDFLVTFRRTA